MQDKASLAGLERVEGKAIALFDRTVWFIASFVFNLD
jgi:hypothetical protein